MMKSTKSVKKYVIVDLTNVKNPYDVYAAFVEAKCGVEPITKEEMFNYAMYVTELMNSTIVKSCDRLIDYIDALFDVIERAHDIPEDDEEVEDECELKREEPEEEKKVEKKPNIFKRFWNWITRKK